MKLLLLNQSMLSREILVLARKCASGQKESQFFAPCKISHVSHTMRLLLGATENTQIKREHRKLNMDISRERVIDNITIGDIRRWAEATGSGCRKTCCNLDRVKI